MIHNMVKMYITCCLQKDHVVLKHICKFFYISHKEMGFGSHLLELGRACVCSVPQSRTVLTA